MLGVNPALLLYGKHKALPCRLQPRRRSGYGRSVRRSGGHTRRSRWDGAGMPSRCVWHHGCSTTAQHGLIGPGCYLAALASLSLLPKSIFQAKLDAEIAARAEQERLIIEQQRAAARAAEEQRRR